MTDQKSGLFESYLYDGEGIIAWRRGTGDNVEITYLRVDKTRQGVATRLFRRMLEALRDNPPYYSVYGFTRVTNEVAQAFYQAVGFHTHLVPGVYADGTAVLFSEPYETLCSIHNVERK